jgi:rubredoxin
VKCAEPGQVTAEADAETRTAVATHICADCGYLYVPSESTGIFADLRDDFTCPQCDAPKSRFATYDPVTGKASGKALKATIAEETETTQEDGEEEEAKKSNDASTDGPSAREIGTVAVFVALLGAAVGGAGGPTGAASEVTRAANLLVTNHLPGVGGVVEDTFLGLLTVCTVYCLWRSSVIPRPVGNPITRRSRTNASWVHVLSGAGALATGLYGVVLERGVPRIPGLDVDVGELRFVPDKRAHLRPADADLQGVQRR